MIDFYRRALKKLDKLDTEQRRELLVSAVGEISLLETVLDSIDVGILVCDENNNLTMVNKYAQRLLPLNYSEGVQLWDAVGDDRIVEFFKETLLNRDRIMDKEIDIDYMGRNRLLSVNVLPLVQDRRITGSLIYIEDITEKRKGEARLRRAENLASLTTLAAGVAHEIKNPLGSISIHLQLLQKALVKINYSGNKTEKYLNVIKEEVDRLNRIVVDFLFAVRPMVLELREGDINALVSQMMEFVAFEMEQSKILCMLELDENVPKILMDERLLKQALLNLVKNAQAAMPDGGVLTIATNHADNEIRISVCDTGAGISKENLTKIFDPYFTTKETGTGLGLTQVFKIIREHQGEITVDSVPDIGTEFKIILPVPQKETRMIAYDETGRAASFENAVLEGEGI
ncbi:MAG: PAS domain S-box protein [Treponema sp.]|jgi:PAS domain S-box-containing protein|nr:PAS domain S-box protein [Treponema sp.]